MPKKLKPDKLFQMPKAFFLGGKTSKRIKANIVYEFNIKCKFSRKQPAAAVHFVFTAFLLCR